MERVAMIEFKGIDLVFQRLTDRASLRRALAASMQFPEDRVSVIDDMSEYPDRAAADVVCITTPLEGDYSTMVSIQNEPIVLPYDSHLSLAQHICELLDTQCLAADEGADPYLMWLLSPRAAAQRVALDTVALDDGRYEIAHRSDSPL
jgi:hypothetical protein